MHAAKRIAIIAIAAAVVGSTAVFTFGRLVQGDPRAPRPNLIETLVAGRERRASLGSAGETLSGTVTPAPGADAEGRPPAPPARALPASVTVPIVIYHHVRPRTPGLSSADRQYEITPGQFEAHLRLLKDRGYASITFAQLAAALEDGAPLPEKPVILCFDDGRDSQYAAAVPLLRKYGFGGTFFVFTNAIGRPGYLTWDQLSELVAEGMEVGSHGVYHPFLTRIGDDEMRWELERSRAVLEERLGIEMRLLAYPFGLVDERVIDASRAAGYSIGRGLDHRTVHAKDDLMNLGAHIVTADIGRFSRIVSTEIR